MSSILDFDRDRLERTAELIRAHATRRPVLVHDADVPAGDPPEWVDAVPPEWDEIGDVKQPPPGAKPADSLAVLTLQQLREKAGSISWLVKHAIPADSIGLLFGGSGTFKSFVCLDAALHVAHGMAWMGRKTRQAPVVYIAAEGGAGLWRRIEAWHRQRGINWDDCPLYVIPTAVDLLTDAASVYEAVAALGITPGLIVVDTLSQTFSGEENSAQEVSNYLRELGLWLRGAWQCAVIVIHHTGHVATERPRGSSAMRANVDFMLGCYRDEKEMLATVSCEKQKDGELFKDAMFALSVFEFERDEDGDPVTALVAHAVLSDEEKQELIQHEAAKGRSGRNALLLDLAQNGMQAEDLRRAFYESCDAKDTDARRQAYFRALAWAKKAGLLEIVDGYVLLSKVARNHQESAK